MIIGLTGRIAAGKGYVVAYLLEKSFKYTTLSQLIRDELSRRGLEVTRKNLQDIGNEVREKEGATAWIKRLVQNLKENENYIVDGIRNPGEINELKKHKDFFLIALDAPQLTRFERVVQRNKASDPKTWEGFLEMDTRDFGEDNPLGQQVGKCMQVADFHIMNDLSVEELNKKIDDVFGIISEMLKNREAI